MTFARQGVAVSAVRTAEIAAFCLYLFVCASGGLLLSVAVAPVWLYAGRLVGLPAGALRWSASAGESRVWMRLFERTLGLPLLTLGFFGLQAFLR